MPTTPAAGATVYRKFTTRAFATGVPTTLAGSPVVSIYKDGSTTQSVAGVTLAADFDSVTGLNHVAIDTSADGAFYANGSHFELAITTGTVGGTSVVGEVVGEFDLAAAVTYPTNFSSLAITAAGGVTLADAVAHGGTPGSSTATLALKRFQVTNSGGANAVVLSTSGDTGYPIYVTNSGSDVAGIFFDCDGGPSIRAQNFGNVVELLSLGDGHGISVTAAGTAKHGIVSTGGTDGDGFHGLGAGTGVGFSSTPDATGFGSGGGGLDAAGVRDAVGLATANLDTQLAAIKSDTGSAVTTLSTMTTTLSTIAGYIDTEIGSIISTLSTVTTSLSTIAGYIDTEISSIISTLATVAGDVTTIVTQTGTIADAAEIADKLLGRNIAGGSDGGRTVSQAMFFLRNKWTISGGTLTVYATNDSTSSWTSAVVTAAGNPVVSSDPA